MVFIGGHRYLEYILLPKCVVLVTFINIYLYSCGFILMGMMYYVS